MPTFMFSAVFSSNTKKIRLDFLHRVLASFEEPVRFVGFNTNGTASAKFDMVNADDGSQKELANPEAHVLRLLREFTPARADELLQQANGEFTALSANVKRHMRNLVRQIEMFCSTLDKYKPDYVYLWNQFNAFHSITAEILKVKGIRHGFFHDGLLPGSVALDFDGEMGESWVARNSDLFLSIEPTAEELESAAAFYDLLTQQSLSRHPQNASIDVMEALRLAKLDDRPFIFYAGQNDWHAGIKPDSAQRAFHSPHFEGSLEALSDLDAMATAMGAAIVFKPHPLSRDRYAFLQQASYKSTLILQSIDLDLCVKQCTVMSTIASQAAYGALFAGKPVVMLGRNQLTGKGLTYDLNSKKSLADVFRRALKDPLKKKRRDEIVKHIAQLQKAYLFDYGNMPNDFYKRGPAAAGQFMLRSLRTDPAELARELVGARSA